MKNGKTTKSIKIIGLLAMCLANLLFMHISVLHNSQIEEALEWTHWITNFSRITLDVIVVLSMCLLLTWGRFKASLSITFVITLIWSFANVLYSRFFFHYISLTAMGEAGAMTDGLVFDSMLAGLRYADLYYVLISVAFFWLWRRTQCRISWRRHLKVSLLTLIVLLFIELFANVVFCAAEPGLRYWGYYKRRMGMRIFGQNHILAMTIYAHFNNGSVKNLAIEGILNLQGNIKLSAEQRATIEQQLANSSSTLTRQEGIKVKNVIFILVESYMSFVTDRLADGREVTPFLNALKRDSTVYYNGQVQPNITIGESADGQYIYMTGLLPLRSMLTVSKANKKPLPGLPKQLRKAGFKQSRMILPTSSSMWRQDDMCQQYGFDHLYASNDYPGEHKQTLTDEQVFELANLVDKESAEGFFSIVLTASMHQPYTKNIDPSFIIQDPSLTDAIKYYLNVCHYTDRAIEKYLESLKTLGLYDNSLIVIASDHHIHFTDFGEDVKKDIPMFIIHGDMGSNAYQGPCNQIDLYTTLMDILAIHDAWPGIGHSLLDAGYQNSLTDQKWDVAEWILLSDYLTDK